LLILKDFLSFDAIEQMQTSARSLHFFCSLLSWFTNFRGACLAENCPFAVGDLSGIKHV
jgi:hypothetical protein